MPIGERRIYSDEYLKDLKAKFLHKFDSGSGTKIGRCKLGHFAKGTIDGIRKTNRSFRKRTIELMRAYLLDRKPRFLDIPFDHIWCTSCEEYIPRKEQHNLYYCKPCHNANCRKS